MARNRRPNGSPSNPVRSVRVDDATWNRAVRRASFEGLTISDVALRFIRGYADGQIDAPVSQLVFAGHAAVPAQAPALDDGGAEGQPSES